MVFLKFYFAKDCDYYDLIRLPHGHWPAPMLFFLWKYLPIPRGKPRDDSFYKCHECGRNSFFKILRWCDICESELQNCYDSEFNWDKLKYEDKKEKLNNNYQKRLKRENKRFLLKKIEHIFLPILLLFGKVKYNKSTRLKDWEVYY